MFRSRKLWMAIGGIAAVLLRDVIGLSPDASQQIVNLIMIYVGGQGVVDAAKGFRK